MLTKGRRTVLHTYLCFLFLLCVSQLFPLPCLRFRFELKLQASSVSLGVDVDLD
jgi:hypothetical protein